MKLLLTSNGLVTSEIVSKLEELVGKSLSEVNVAVINEAYSVEHDDHKWVIDDLVRLKDNVGGRIELVNLLANSKDVIEERLEASDVIFVIGGFTDYLKQVYDSSGVTEMLPELLKTRVYVGISAGSMVVGRRISNEAYKVIYGEGREYEVPEYLNLVNFSIMPHLNSPDFPNRKEVLLDAVKLHGGLVYGLQDDAAVIVDGDEVTTVGTKPLELIKGKIDN